MPLASVASVMTLPSTPGPSAPKFVPSHKATRLAETPPALVKLPPKNSASSMTIIAKTALLAPFGEMLFLRTLFHTEPFHRARLLADAPPALENAPPAYNSPSKLASARTGPLMPVLRRFHVKPFHRAMFLAETLAAA